MRTPLRGTKNINEYIFSIFGYILDAIEDGTLKEKQETSSLQASVGVYLGKRLPDDAQKNQISYGTIFSLTKVGSQELAI